MATDTTSLMEGEIENTVVAYHQIEQLKNGIEHCQETIDLIHEAIAVELSKEPEKEEEIIQTFATRLQHFGEKIKQR